jgi:hypothetical protein
MKPFGHRDRCDLADVWSDQIALTLGKEGALRVTFTEWPAVARPLRLERRSGDTWHPCFTFYTDAVTTAIRAWNNGFWACERCGGFITRPQRTRRHLPEGAS